MKRTLCCLLFLATLAYGDEGMYPISEIPRLNLRAMGLLLSSKEIYNPKGTSLIDAIVDVGGCSGSFVSSEGLIITNHHCVFGALAAASTPAKDYATNGFLARTRAEEISARGSTVRIIESYRDVSPEVLGVLADSMSPGTRTGAISRKTKAMVAEIEQKNPGRRAEVAEMFPGKSYVLFVYLFLKDVRLVYSPPRSIGEFGGEEDNWVWPRHTGDFSFMRAYVAPDGSPADYSPANVPYHPRRHLRVQPAGVDEEDAVFILGYPGRTYRHRTAEFLAYEQRCRMPFIAELYEWEIATMQEAGRSDRAVALKFDARIKGLANTSKNYRGKLQGMGRLDLVGKKRAEEKALQEYIDGDPARKAAYGQVLGEIAAVYREMEERAGYELTLDILRSVSVPLSASILVADAAVELPKPDVERRNEFMERNFPRTKEAMGLSLKNYHQPTDRTFLREMLRRAARLPAGERIREVDALLSGPDTLASIDAWLEGAYAGTRFADSAFVVSALSRPGEAVGGGADSFLSLARSLLPAYDRLRERRAVRDGILSRNYALLVDVKQRFLKTRFIPDANSTMRFTQGRIRGYTPADATRYTPITTLAGVVEKTTGREPFRSPEALLELARKKDYGRFLLPRLKSVPVALLYNLDTTGGNSGSPLLNARGELVGVNFDRAFGATINDYAWSEEYSRSIAVDIRYVLWVTEKIGGATHILREMGL